MSVFKRIARAPDGQQILAADGQPVREETYTIRFELAGKEYWVRTSFTRKEDAEKREREVRAEKDRARQDAALATLKRRHDQTIGTLVQSYLAAGCPGRDLYPKTGRSKTDEESRLHTALQWWAPKIPQTITLADHEDYWVWRRSRVSRGTGDRSTELELQSLSNVFTWAVRRRLVETNPFARRRVYRKPGTISHAREFMPATTVELHQIVGALLDDGRSECLGWGYLLSAFTGLRFCEVRNLRDQSSNQSDTVVPGSSDEKFFYIRRAKGGKNPRVRLDDPDRPYIRPLLETIRSWKRDRYPASPWLIPGRMGEQLSAGALSHSLKRVTNLLGLPKRSGHGARAYYATVRWAQGIDPDQIAHELGQRSGEELVREVYGGSPPQWDGLLNSKAWLPPNGQAAWSPAGQPGNVISI